jgi:hypothetical protein
LVYVLSPTRMVSNLMAAAADEMTAQVQAQTIRNLIMADH